MGRIRLVCNQLSAGNVQSALLSFSKALVGQCSTGDVGGGGGDADWEEMAETPGVHTTGPQ